MPRATKRCIRTTGAGASDQVAPPFPPETAEEAQASAAFAARLRELCDILQQRNLDNAVRLAQQAAARRGPLVDYFNEIGRRFAGELDARKKKPSLRVIEGSGLDALCQTGQAKRRRPPTLAGADARSSLKPVT